jgi:hypothetical protein
MSQYLAYCDTQHHIAITSLSCYCAVLSALWVVSPFVLFFQAHPLSSHLRSRATNKLNNRTKYHITITTHHLRTDCSCGRPLLVWLVLCPGRGMLFISRVIPSIPNSSETSIHSIWPSIYRHYRTHTPVGAGHCCWSCVGRVGCVLID